MADGDYKIKRGWSTEIPDEPGYYWGRYCGTTVLVVFKGADFGVTVVGDSRDRPYADDITHWLPAEPEPPK